MVIKLNWKIVSTVLILLLVGSLGFGAGQYMENLRLTSQNQRLAGENDVLKQQLRAGTGYTVGTSTASDATEFATQRKVCFQSGRFWYVYPDGTNLVYRTSLDGVSWSSATTIRSNANWGGEVTTTCDGTYLHYAYSDDNWGSNLYYRRGLAAIDGSITWSTAEQIAVAGAATAGNMLFGSAGQIQDDTRRDNHNPISL
jgi:hypothetical protein